MLTSMDMYWLTRLDPIRVLLKFIVLFGLFASVGAVAAGIIQKHKNLLWIGYGVSVIFMAAVAGMVFVPTTKEMVAIYVVPALANNEQVRSIPDTALKLADEYLKQKLDELIGEKHKK